VVSLPKKNTACLNVDKLSRIARKMFHFLMRKTKKPCKAYAVLLILKIAFDEEFCFKKDEFKQFLDGLRRLDKDYA